MSGQENDASGIATHKAKLLVLDFGSQYTHVICRRYRQLGIFCEVLRGDLPWTAETFPVAVKGVVLSGGPAGVYEEGSPHIDASLLKMIKEQGIPVLGICYGLQELVHQHGGKIATGGIREYGACAVDFTAKAVEEDEVFKGLQQVTNVWMSHGDFVGELPPGFETMGSSENHVAAVRCLESKIWGVQFHPEVTHTAEGMTILKNFATTCGLNFGDWNMWEFANLEIEALRKKIAPGEHVLGAVSGGVDSSVAAALLFRALGPRFHPVFVDTGYLRLNERAEVEKRFKSEIPSMELTTVDASELFYEALKDVKEPEEKRKIIGRLFVETFEAEAHKIFGESLDHVWLLQGTLYPDVIESVSWKGPSVKIKTHHNVGGLPEKMKMRVIEPLRDLFKDEVRKLGNVLELSKETVGRHPFPGPGLAIRILGNPTRENVLTLQRADAIFMDELRANNLYFDLAQAFVVLLAEAKTVGVMGDNRTYEYVACLRAVTSDDYMTADWADLPKWFLSRVSTRIINEVPGINRVAYDISTKPPATIEWE